MMEITERQGQAVLRLVRISQEYAYKNIPAVPDLQLKPWERHWLDAVQNTELDKLVAMLEKGT